MDSNRSELEKCPPEIRTRQDKYQETGPNMANTWPQIAPKARAQGPGPLARAQGPGPGPWALVLIY